MKHLKKFGSVSAMKAAITASEITIVGLAFDGTTPVNGRKSVTTPPPPPVVDPTVPFYIEDISGDANTIQIKKDSSVAPTLTIEKSTDGKTWETMGTTSTTAITATVPANGKLYLRCSATQWASGNVDYYNGIRTTGNCNVGGNIMSLLYGSSFNGQTEFPNTNGHNFKRLFYNNTHVVNAENLLLPATTLGTYCYDNMFGYCTSLTTAPELPATTLANRCYRNMFTHCTSLTAVPALPATTLDEACYAGMFQGCTSLTTAPTLPATTLTRQCYDNMFNGCTSLTTAPELPATTLGYYCYSNMFIDCTSLAAAPELPATTLAETCYGAMFYNCKSLTTAPELPATTLAKSCYNSMFYGCTSLAAAPELPATTLADYCYYRMFYDCRRLNYIKCLATDISANTPTYTWVAGVSSTGTFVKDPNMSGWPTGVSGIPSGWTVEDAGGISLEQNLNVATIKINDLDEGTGYYTINGGSHISVGNGKTTIPITQEMNGQTLLVYGEFSGEPSEETLTLSWTDYSPSVTITETNNYVTINSPNADVIKYRLGSSGSFTTYTEPVYIAEDTTIYVQATRTVAGVDYTSTASQEVTHELIPPTNLVISCAANTVTITADNAATIEYNFDGSSTYTTYTAPFEITQTVTVYAKASNADGSITASQECEYSAIPFAENLVFYAPLTEGDLTDHISGKSPSTDSGCTVTWNSTYNMYQLYCSGSAYRAALRWVELSLYDAGHNISTDGLTVTARMKFVSQSGNNYSAFYACDSLKDTMGQYANNKAFLYACNARFSGGVGSNIIRLTTTLTSGGSQNIKFYKNSTLAKSMNWETANVSATRAPDTLSLCEMNTNNTNMTILISDVRVYNRVLSASEIGQL